MYSSIQNNKNTVYLSVVIFVLCIMTLFFILPKNSIGTSHANLTGWAWSSNVGWISFNSDNPDAGPGSTYGVDVSPETGTGIFSGFAWNSNIGWINFKPTEATPEGPDYTGSGHSAELDWSTGVVTGWARACAGYANPDLCSGAISTDGWDGWIKLSDSGGIPYRVVLDTDTSPNEFSGFAWGADVMGWIDFNVGLGNGVKVGGATGNARPLAQITGPASATVTKFTDSTQTATQSFVGTGTDNLTIPSSLNYEWLSAGCAISKSTSSSFTETYVGNGTYTMCLKVQDDDIVPLWSINDPSRTIILKFAECSDHIDNDGDGDVDMADGSCLSGFGNDENATPPTPQCSDGLDNENDGFIDFAGGVDTFGNTLPPDPGCAGDPNGTDEGAIPIITSCFGGAPDGICQIGAGETILNCPADCFRIREI